MISTRNISAFIIVTIYLNLYISTLSIFVRSRLDLSSLLADLLAFKICDKFILIEIEYELDTRNLETTTTLLSNRSFDLYTLSIVVTKAIDLTTSLARVSRIVVVFAHLIVKHDDHGVKPFLV